MLVDCVRVEEEWWMIWKEINMGLSARFNLSYISVFAYVFVSVLVFVFMSIFIFVFWLYSYLRWWSIQRWSIWVGAQFNPSYIFLTSLLQTGPWGKCRRPWQMRLPYESREKWKIRPNTHTHALHKYKFQMHKCWQPWQMRLPYERREKWKISPESNICRGGHKDGGMVY